MFFFFFFFNDTATTEIYTLSLHDALPISEALVAQVYERTRGVPLFVEEFTKMAQESGDRKSTRLNSSHPSISYAVFCLKKKKKKTTHREHKNQTTKRSTVHETRNKVDTIN